MCISYTFLIVKERKEAMDRMKAFQGQPLIVTCNVVKEKCQVGYFTSESWQ